MITPEELHFYFTDNDILRLNSYSRNLVDYHMIMDLLPYISKLYYLHKFCDLNLSSMQQRLIIGHVCYESTEE